MKQLDLNLYKGSHGGRRPGSGRKRIHSKGVSHRKREKVTRHTPLHINFKYRMYIRTESFMMHSERAIESAENHGMKVSLFTIQSNHIHLIAEVNNNISLTRSMQSLTNTITFSFKKGSIQLERYHLHVLKSPAETRHAIAYVLLNDLKHTGKFDKRFTKILTKGECWLLKKATSSLKDIASVTSRKFLYP